MISKRTLTTVATAGLFAGLTIAAQAQVSDQNKTAPTRTEPGSSEGRLPSTSARPKNEPGSSEGMTSPGSKSNAEAEAKKTGEKPGSSSGTGK